MEILDHKSKEEHVILVDERDREIGVFPKSLVHHKDTPLHRGFSIYIFSKRGNIFVQQRNKTKRTWGGFWSNSCCGHPAPGESYEIAIARRTKQELGREVRHIQKITDYRYRVEHNGVVENEICPVFAGFFESEIVRPNPDEIENFQWMQWSEYLTDMQKYSDTYSPWSKEQVLLLRSSAVFQEWLTRNDISLR